MQLLAVVSSALLIVSSAVAETVHLHFAGNTGLCAGPTLIVAPFDHSLDVITCGAGNATSSDLTALTVTSTDANTPTQISFGDLCVTTIQDGTVSGDAYFVPCSDDPGLLWTFQTDGTIANDNGTCLTVGRAGNNAPVSLGVCSQFPDKQGWQVEVL